MKFYDDAVDDDDDEVRTEDDTKSVPGLRRKK